MLAMTTNTVTRQAAWTFPLWKKSLLGAACLLMVIGGYLAMTRSATVSQPVAAKQGFASSLQPGGPTLPQFPSDATGAPADPAWQAGLFKVGFGFFVGFAAGHALRFFFRGTLILVGIVAIALLALQYSGMVTIDWHAMQGHFDSITAWLNAQTASFQHFVAGEVPSGASLIAGIGVGFKR